MVVKEESEAPRTALYRKYRPNSLAGVVGQSRITDILTRSLTQGKTAHAYLLTGPRGVGKTSIARILAHEINNLPYDGEKTYLDIIEIDAASNNGVEDVRELREKVQIAPISASKKVYIIDEVHMLSKPAFNALLKTLEEPPAHVVFIMATTDLHKVPATIISRTQHFAFHSISPADLSAHLKVIAKKEGIKITDDALDIIANRGDGSFRDSISLLDQLSSFADDKDGITTELIQATLGLASYEAVDKLLLAVKEHDGVRIISLLNDIEAQGVQANTLADQLIQALRGQLSDEPQLVNILDALLDVSSSSQPQLKLLTTLLSNAKPATSQRTVATVASKPVPVPQPTVLEAPVIVIEKIVREVILEPKPQNTEAFDWNKLVSYVKEHYVALYSVLSLCSYELDGDKLTIYAVRKFNKTKLDDTRYLTQLYEALVACGQFSLTVVSLPTSKPLANASLAKVAAIMGGGVEVSLEETK